MITLPLINPGDSVGSRLGHCRLGIQLGRAVIQESGRCGLDHSARAHSSCPSFEKESEVMSCLHPSAVNTAVTGQLNMACVGRHSGYRFETDLGALHYACFTCISPCRRMWPGGEP